MNSHRLSPILSVLLAAVATLAIACGPSLEQLEAHEACREQCGLGMARCFETRTCLAIDGQIIPCEEDCQSEHDACEEGCVAD
ncbi:MAG: hypothetical protein JRF63_08550 [Deltaproteobacteria bacterium]|nr:hypothetical protein [Deltaproteobacteria bacterium]